MVRITTNELRCWISEERNTLNEMFAKFREIDDELRSLTNGTRDFEKLGYFKKIKVENITVRRATMVEAINMQKAVIDHYREELRNLISG